MEESWENIKYMSKESSSKTIETNSVLSEIGDIKQSNSFSKPVIRTAITLSILTLSATSGNNSKILTGIEKELVEYNDNSNNSLVSYKIPEKQYVVPNSGKLVIADEKNYTLSLYEPNAVSQKVISDLREENAILRNRLRNSLPVHAIVYMVGNGIVGAIAATLLVVRYFLNIYIIDPYYLFCALIITSGLFFTALISLKDWKDNLLR